MNTTATEEKINYSVIIRQITGNMKNRRKVENRGIDALLNADHVSGTLDFTSTTVLETQHSSMRMDTRNFKMDQNMQNFQILLRRTLTHCHDEHFRPSPSNIAVKIIN